ncbi:hypothetical protein D5F01_LYC04597 [Larimichthys crocea]|uniref:Uncharacterized protein n=1 Tax=Larimichthys crocea TaxID=215358 RepID=A0A6G0IX57_LARCR|nr:hypothetical protein D5F01_LYC04597 [Larimichthys crocea]
MSAGGSPQSVPAEQRSLVGLSKAAEPVSDGLRTGAGRHRGVEVERTRTTEEVRAPERGGRMEEGGGAAAAAAAAAAAEIDVVSNGQPAMQPQRGDVAPTGSARRRAPPPPPPAAELASCATGCAGRGGGQAAAPQSAPGTERNAADNDDGEGRGEGWGRESRGFGGVWPRGGSSSSARATDLPGRERREADCE